MTPEVICLILLGTIASLVIVRELYWPGLPKVNEAVGEHLVCYPTMHRIWAASLFFLLPLEYTLMSIHRPPGDGRAMAYVIYSGCISICTLAAAWYTWETMRWFVISKDGVDCHSPWQARRFVPWAEVRDITSSRNHHAIIQAADGWKFRALGGPRMKEFLVECRRYVSFGAIAAACYTPRRKPFEA
jgi:hypothetical protein